MHGCHVFYEWTPSVVLTPLLEVIKKNKKTKKS